MGDRKDVKKAAGHGLPPPDMNFVQAQHNEKTLFLPIARSFHRLRPAVALKCAVIVAVQASVPASWRPARADGGSGDHFSTNDICRNGGKDNTTGQGEDGGRGNLRYGDNRGCTGGGGGGGAGVTGGAGGAGFNASIPGVIVPGGAGGTASSRDGKDGADAVLGQQNPIELEVDGGGGGGGAAGFVGAHLPGGPAVGGNGGNGGNGSLSINLLSGGGGGGGGAFGAVVTSSGTLLGTLTADIVGGNGGRGGAGWSASQGGDGGGGLWLSNGSFDNQATIRGGTGGDRGNAWGFGIKGDVGAGTGGVGLVIATGTVGNIGIIRGGTGGGAGTGAYGGGGRGGLGLSGLDSTVVNAASGAIEGGGGGGGVRNGSYGGHGGDGIGTSNSIIRNAGLIAGGGGHAGLPQDDVFSGGAWGGNGGRGAVTAGGSLDNTGSIRGGDGGAGADDPGFSSRGGDGGVGIAASGTMISNSATIAGGNGGAGGTAGAGGAGISGGNLTIVNSGTISGGLAGGNGGRADAITFAGGTNRLELRVGAVVIGTVNATAGTADTLSLGGSQDGGFSVSAIGPAEQYRGFERFEKNGTGTWTLQGTTTAVTPWIINDGTLAISDDGNLGAASGSVTMNGGTLRIDGGIASSRVLVLDAGGGTIATPGLVDSFAHNGAITGAGHLTKTGSGFLFLDGENSYSGGTTVAGGALYGTTRSLQGDIVNNATLIFDQETAGTYAGRLTGNGTLGKLGAGALTLSGNNDGFSGTTGVQDGTLHVAGRLGGAVLVEAGGTLSGTGVLTGAVTVDGTLSAGASPGTLRVGSLTLNAGATSVFELNAPGVVNDASNDLVKVTGSLTLGGTLDARAAAAGYYRLFDYGGTLSGSFISVGVTGTGGFVPVAGEVQTVIPGQVNLAVRAAGQTLQFWDGADITGNGTVDGGAGTWSSAHANWTGRPGEAGINGTWSASVGIFMGAAGTVAVVGTQAFDTLQFSTDGYRLTGGTLALAPASGTVGVINIDAGVTATITSAIQDGTGTGLRKLGGGTLILDGINSYSGGTELRAGTVSVSRDANLGAAAGGITFTGGALAITTSFATGRAVTLAGAGRFDIADGSALQLTGTVSGDGDIVKTGAGTLRLDNAANRYGNTLVAAGTLIGHAGSISGNIGNAGTVVFDQADDGRFDGATGTLDGAAGTMIKRGAGSLTLTGTSTLAWTVEAGGLVTAAERFGGNAAIGTGATLTFAQDKGASYGGVLSGAGSFVKAGSGALLLTGDSTGFAGTTAITGGTLLVGNAAGQGRLGGSVTVQAGGALGGHGIVGSGAGSIVTIAAGGTLAPGSSIGTLTVNGSLVFDGGSRFLVEVDPAGGSSDRVTVTGDATIHGGGVVHIGAGGSYRLRSTYTILSAGGTLSGRFDGVTSNFAFLTPELGYDYAKGTVDLRLQRNDIAFAARAATRNQIAAATGLDSIGVAAAHPVFDAVALLPDDVSLIRRAFDQLSGEIHASAKTALIEDSRFVREAAGDRIRAAFAAVAASPLPVMAYAGGEPHRVAATAERFTVWGSGFGAWGETRGDGNAARLSRSTGGFLIGADGPVLDGWRLGLLAGYSRTSFNIRDRRSAGWSDSYHLGLYGGTQWGPLGLRAGLAYAWHMIETSRSVAFPGLADTLRGGYRAGTFQAFGELGYRVDVGSAAFEPFAHLAHVSFAAGGVEERGGATALHAGSQSTGVTFTTLGLRAATGLAFGSMNLTVRGTLGWRHAFGAVIPLATQSFSAGQAFTVAGSPIARNAVVAEAGLDLALSPAATLGLSYSGQIAADARQHGFKASFGMRF